MEILIHQYLFVVLDTENKMLIPSQSMEIHDDLEKSFVESLLKKMVNKKLRSCTIENIQENNQLLKNYVPFSLSNLAEKIAPQLFDYKMQVGRHELSDLFFIECRLDDVEYVVIFDKTLKKALSHHTLANENHSFNQLIQINNLVSDGLAKEDSWILYDYKNNEAFIDDAKVLYQGENKNLFSDLLFNISATLKEKEVVEVMEKSVKEISRKYDLDLQETLPELKSAFADCDFLEVEEVAKTVFEKLPAAKEEFRIQVENAGVKESIPFETSKLPKKDRTLRLVTESGIEIVIPSVCLKRKDKVEIINHADGTSSIEIKNIEKLKNR